MESSQPDLEFTCVPWVMAKQINPMVFCVDVTLLYYVMEKRVIGQRKSPIPGLHSSFGGRVLDKDSVNWKGQLSWGITDGAVLKATTKTMKRLSKETFV